jgi:hypothetical protein
MTIGDKVIQAVNKTQGTKDYYKFYMECYDKIDNRWKFICWSYPSSSANVIKKHGKELYIMGAAGMKYKIHEDVKRLLGL